MMLTFGILRLMLVQALRASPMRCKARLKASSSFGGKFRLMEAGLLTNMRLRYQELSAICMLHAKYSTQTMLLTNAPVSQKRWDTSTRCSTVSVVHRHLPAANYSSQESYRVSSTHNQYRRFNDGHEPQSSETTSSVNVPPPPHGVADLF